MKQVVINLSDRLYYVLILVGIVSLFGVGVYAFGGSEPSVMGHNYAEVGFPEDCVDEQVLRWNETSSSWICGEDNVIDSSGTYPLMTVGSATTATTAGSATTAGNGCAITTSSRSCSGGDGGAIVTTYINCGSGGSTSFVTEGCYNF